MVHVVSAERVHHGKRVVAALALILIPAVAAGYYFGYNVGSLSITITDDAVHDFTSLNISFSAIQVHSDGALTPSGWVTVKLQARSIDLLRLADNVTLLLGLDKITAGKYSELRIVVDSAGGVLKDGSAVDVRVPSGELKTETPFDLKPQGSLSILVRLLVVQTAGSYSLRPAFGGVTEA
jgi:hypothetical protein